MKAVPRPPANFETWVASAAGDIKHLRGKRIRGAADPISFGKALRGELKGFWRYRAKDDRILCRIENHRGAVVVVVVAAGHRSTIYDGDETPASRPADKDERSGRRKKAVGWRLTKTAS